MLGEWQGGDFVLTEPPGQGQVMLCLACSRLGHCRLGLRAESLSDGVVTTDIECGPENEGGPRVAHGGWTAGVLDELVGHVPIMHRQLSVTGTLSIRYLKPVPIGRPLRGRAQLVRREGRRWYVEASLSLAASGAELATAEAVMVERDPAHFERHRRWLAEQDNAISPEVTGDSELER
jgi:acyl-coenzyme A thioesterase PaaI-like protein